MYLESLESSSVHTYRALQIEQRRCLGSLESCSVHTPRMMQGRRRRTVASLEGRSVVIKEQCRVGEQRPCEQPDTHQRNYAERAEHVSWRPWEQLIAHGRTVKRVQMVSSGHVWLIEG